MRARGVSNQDRQQVPALALALAGVFVSHFFLGGAFSHVRTLVAVL